MSVTGGDRDQMFLNRALVAGGWCSGCDGVIVWSLSGTDPLVSAFYSTHMPRVPPLFPPPTLSEMLLGLLFSRR